MAFWETVLRDNIGSDTADGMDHYYRLAGFLVLSQFQTQLVYTCLNKQRLETCDGLREEVWVPGFATLAVLVVVHGIESRDVLLPQHAHLRAFRQALSS